MCFAKTLITLIDGIYEYVIRLMGGHHICSAQIFRYAFCGGSNMLLDWVLYFLCYNFLVGHDLVYLFGGHICLTPHIATLCIVFPITLLTGFWLNRYVTFIHSTIRGRHQLWRYVLVVIFNLLLNYFGLKFFVELCHWYPTPSKIVITLITVVISYMAQKYFSFATKTPRKDDLG